MQQATKLKILLGFIFLSTMIVSPAFAVNSFNIKAIDTPNDDGRSILVEWKKQPFENDKGKYVILVAPRQSGKFIEVATTLATTGLKSGMPQYFGWSKENNNYHAVKITQAPPPSEFIEKTKQNRQKKIAGLKIKLQAFQKKLDSEKSKRIKNKIKQRIEVIQNEIKRLSKQIDSNTPVQLISGHTYFIKVKYISKDGSEITSQIASATPNGEWFDTGKTNLLFVMLLLSGLVMYYIQKARKHPEKIYLRRIAGLEAIDDAIGRATEMGKPIFFVHGLASMASISTIAAINILGKIAEKVAEYGTEFKVTNRDPVVLAVSQETVKEAYLKAGRPDLYKDDNVFYVSQDQFSYASAIEGMFLRERPASNFFFGYYFAEALLLTETGAAIGSIQIAGTDAYTQLPFFITTCDYTLMGEELYAASAYLSREPMLLGSVKAQDVGKTLMIFTILIGVVLSSFGFEQIVHFFEIF